MCARFTLRTAPSAWLDGWLPMLETSPQPVTFRPRYNIAPTQQVFALASTDQSGPRLMQFRWGLLPPWADDLAVGSRMVNARSESLLEKPAFKQALLHRHCAIPADGYLEWLSTSEGKQPYLMHLADSSPFFFAGLWEINSRISVKGASITSCTIITTTANATTASIHDRMPVLMNMTTAQDWLSTYADFQDANQILRAAPEDWLQITGVSRRVNRVQNDDPDCLRPAPWQGELF